MLKKLLDPRGLALGRTFVGVTMITQPGLIPGLLGVDSEASTKLAWAVQMLGAREIALGAGSLASRKERRLWHAAGLLSDTVDAVALAGALKLGTIRKTSGGGAVLVAVVAAGAGAGALRRG